MAISPYNLERLEEESSKTEPLYATTVRFHKAIDKEIRAFCAENPRIARGVILRECLERGWAALNGETTK
jgi:hypothetical protein